MLRWWTQEECIASGKSVQYCTVDLYVPSKGNETCLSNNTRCETRHIIGAAGQHVCVLSMVVFLLSIVYEFARIAPVIVRLGSVVTNAAAGRANLKGAGHAHALQVNAVHPAYHSPNTGRQLPPLTPTPPRRNSGGGSSSNLDSKGDTILVELRSVSDV